MHGREPDGGRRRFNREAIAALLGGLTVTVCSGRSPTRPSSPPLAPPDPTSPAPSLATPPPPTDRIGVFHANHRHEAVITAAELTAGGGLLLDIRGEANHPHILDLSAAEIVAIARGEEVGKESTEVKGHTHFVTFNVNSTAR
jgi:hypothetical protein